MRRLIAIIALLIITTVVVIVFGVLLHDMEAGRK